MKLDLNELRELTKKNKPRLEEEKRRKAAERQAMLEDIRRKEEEAEEARFQRQIEDMERTVKFEAGRGSNYARLEAFLPYPLGVRKTWFLSRYPKTISREYLPSDYHRLYDYCKEQGLKVAIEFDTIMEKYYLTVYW
jgi:hypothetical protein